MTTYNEAFARLIGHEGKFQNDPRDRGNWTTGVVGQGTNKGTKYGVSAMAYPGEDIVNLTLERAREIYMKDYWGPAGCDAVPSAIRFDLFDMAVNSGVKRAISTLQLAVGVYADGVLGPLTLQGIQSMPALRFVARFNGHRLQYVSALPTWPAFGRGWSNRIAQNLIEV